MTLEQYRNALARHDWWYAYSDDHDVWSRGRDIANALRLAQAKLDPDYAIWNEIAPADFRVAV